MFPLLQRTLKLLLAAATPLLEDVMGDEARKAMKKYTANILGDVNEVRENLESCSAMLIVTPSFLLFYDALGLTSRLRVRPFQGTEAPLFPPEIGGGRVKWNWW